MDRSAHAESSTSLAPPKPTYAFTVPAPRRQQRHKAAPGCSLCTILVNLEHEQTVQNVEEENLGRIEVQEQPLSPSLPSPAVVQKPLLPVNPTIASIATTTDGRVLVVDDQDLTGWIASPDERLALDRRHVVIAFKRHIEDVYAFGPADIPLLVHALQTAHALLDRTPSISEHSGKGKAKENNENADQRHQRQSRSVENAGSDGCGEGLRKIGLFTGFTRDPRFPYSHLHIHATLGPHDAASWYRRSIIHSAWSPGWWNLEDLIAEIRESTSNNRVKSGYGSRRDAPLSMVPTAGSSLGLPNALELTTQTADAARSAPSVQQPLTSETEPVESRIPADDKHGNVPPTLLNAVIRDAERTFGMQQIGKGERAAAKGKQREVESALESEAGAGTGPLGA